MKIYVLFVGFMFVLIKSEKKKWWDPHPRPLCHSFHFHSKKATNLGIL